MPYTGLHSVSKTAAMLTLVLFFHSVPSFSLHEMPPMRMAASPQSKTVDDLIQQGESDRTTLVTFSVKAYITPEVAERYPNVSESIEYLKDILNKQYTRSMIPIRMKIHCIEVTTSSEAEGMNTLEAFMNYKSSHEELRGSIAITTAINMKRLAVKEPF